VPSGWATLSLLAKHSQPVMDESFASIKPTSLDATSNPCCKTGPQLWLQQFPGLPATKSFPHAWSAK